jgi:hypothetical protein
MNRRWSGPPRSTWPTRRPRSAYACWGAKRRTTKIWDGAATTRAIVALAGEVVLVAVEATSDYRRPFLPARRPWAVRLACERTGREERARPAEGKLDATWLAKLN